MNLDQLCLVNLNVSISEYRFKPPPEFNPNGLMLLSEIRSVIRAMDYYCLDEKFQTRINYRLLLWVAYLHFFLLLIVCIIVPVTSKDECGKGLFWRAHFIMGFFLFFSLALEFSMYFVAIPFDLLKEIVQSAKGDLRDKAFDKIATLLAIVINSWFFISGVIAKADIYTDVAFSLEALK